MTLTTGAVPQKNFEGMAFPGVVTSKTMCPIPEPDLAIFRPET